MVWLAIVKLAAVAYGASAAVRVRFLPALVLGLSGVLTVVLPLIAWMHTDGWVAAALGVAPWAPLAVSAALGGFAARRAFGALDRIPAGSAVEEGTTTVAYALLANALIDAGILVIVLLAMFLASR